MENILRIVRYRMHLYSWSQRQKELYQFEK